MTLSECACSEVSDHRLLSGGPAAIADDGREP